MFYGLSKFFKNILPKRLFYRALLIVAIPIIILQLVITIVFFDSLWIKTNKGMARTISTYVMFKYVKSLLFDNEGRAIIRPIIIARIIETTEI